jgi:hypothetical protein
MPSFRLSSPSAKAVNVDQAADLQTTGFFLLVGEDQESGVLEFVLGHEPTQLARGLLEPVSVVRVDHEDDLRHSLENEWAAT